MKLANLKALGCSSAHPYDINAGSPVRAVGYALCSGKMRLWAWSAVSGSYLIDAAKSEGILEGVGDNGLMVGGLRAPRPTQAIYISDGVPTALPPIDVANGSYAHAVSPDGHFVVGDSYAGGVNNVLLWTYNGTPFDNGVAVTTGSPWPSSRSSW